jgi:hypothetical protein
VTEAEPLVLGVGHAVPRVGSESQDGGLHSGDEDLIGRDAGALIASVSSEAVVAVQLHVLRAFNPSQDGREPVSRASASA